ncbi:MAG: hypothetical protein JWR75_1865 [Devosia sp.]|nr:hypothetical protein [Devosia sp.]
MSSRKDSVAARERVLKRIAIRYGIHVMMPLKPEPKVRAHGGYMLRDGKTMKLLIGEKPYLFAATLEEAEAYIDALEAAAGR